MRETEGGIHLDKLQQILGGLDLTREAGLEFGPLSRPIVQRPGSRVLYVDHLDTASLRQKYANDRALNVADFVPVDIVWADGALRHAVQAAFPGPDRWFGYIVASHVIEHIPDLIWWLSELRSVLSSGGTLRLVIPDRRFTMDFARRETSIADVLAAYLQGARKPGLREILDFYMRYQRVDIAAAWHGTQAMRTMYPLEQATIAIQKAQSAETGAYHDVHCTVYTPRSFLTLMVDLARLGMIWFAFERIYPTIENRLDFVVHMAAADDRDRIEESWRAALTDLQAAEQSGPFLPQDEPARLREHVAAQAARIDVLEQALRAGENRIERLWRKARGGWR
jgi:SAM-dependent methyltransferase